MYPFLIVLVRRIQHLSSKNSPPVVVSKLPLLLYSVVLTSADILAISGLLLQLTKATYTNHSVTDSSGKGDLPHDQVSRGPVLGPLDKTYPNPPNLIKGGTPCLENLSDRTRLIKLDLAHTQSTRVEPNARAALAA